MADPSGPTVARDPDDTASPQPSDQTADPQAAIPGAGPGADATAGAAPGTAESGPAVASPSDGAAAAGGVVDDTGTVKGPGAATEASAGGAGEVAATGAADTTTAPDTASSWPADPATHDTDDTGNDTGATDGGAADATTVPLHDDDDAAAKGKVKGKAGDDGDAEVSDDLDEDEDEDEDLDGDEDDDAPPPRRGGFLTKQVQVDARLILIITAVFALMVAAFFYGRNQAQQAAAPRGTGSTSTTAFAPPKDFVPFEDKETGVKLSVPKDWTRYSTKDLDPAIRLAVGIPNTSDTVVVRVNAYSSEVTQANVGDQKNVFDQLLAAERIEILVNQVTTLRGMPALFYVYRFTDEGTGIKGYHAHYFVFQGRKMVSVIFQALPEARYPVLAPTFDQIASTLEIAPGEPPAFLNPIGGGSTGAPAPPGSAPGPAPTTVPPAPPPTG